MGFPGGSEVKASACNAGDLGSIPGSGRSSGEGNGNPLQYSCLENPIDGGAWWAPVHGVTKSRTRLNDFTSKVQVSWMWQLGSLNVERVPPFGNQMSYTIGCSPLVLLGQCATPGTGFLLEPVGFLDWLYHFSPAHDNTFIRATCCGSTKHCN